MLRKYPNQVERVYIRNVTGASRNSDRWQKTFAGINPDKWQLFTDPSNLKLPLPIPAYHRGFEL